MPHYCNLDLEGDLPARRQIVIQKKTVFFRVLFGKGVLHTTA